MSTVSSIIYSNWVKLLAASSMAFVGYAIYFDHKRRHDPFYKQKIRENRKKKQARRINMTTSSNIDFPDPRDVQACEQFFFQQIQMGEEHIQTGNVTEGVMYLSNAVVSCQQPGELMNIFRQTIPEDHFEMLVRAVPAAKLRQQASLHNLGAKLEEINDTSSEAVGDKKIFIIDDELE